MGLIAEMYREVADALDAKLAAASESSPVVQPSDPTLDRDGLLVAVDADCPDCGWPERWFDTSNRKFGCIKCTYTSDERNA